MRRSSAYLRPYRGPGSRGSVKSPLLGADTVAALLAAAKRSNPHAADHPSSSPKGTALNPSPDRLFAAATKAAKAATAKVSSRPPPKSAAPVTTVAPPSAVVSGGRVWRETQHGQDPSFQQAASPALRSNDSEVVSKHRSASDTYVKVNLFRDDLRRLSVRARTVRLRREYDDLQHRQGVLRTSSGEPSAAVRSSALASTDADQSKVDVSDCAEDSADTIGARCGTSALSSPSPYTRALERRHNPVVFRQTFAQQRQERRVPISGADIAREQAAFNKKPKSDQGPFHYQVQDRNHELLKTLEVDGSQTEVPKAVVTGASSDRPGSSKSSCDGVQVGGSAVPSSEKTRHVAAMWKDKAFSAFVRRNILRPDLAHLRPGDRTTALWAEFTAGASSRKGKKKVPRAPTKPPPG